MDDTWIVVLAVMGTGLVSLIVTLMTLNRLVFVPAPHELLVVTGRQYLARDGSKVSYRLSHKSLVLFPFVERADRLDLRVNDVLIAIQGYAKGSSIARLELQVLFALSASGSKAYNAVERFLGRDKEECVRVATETIEGCTRGIIAQMTPSELHEDRVKFAQLLRAEVEEAFEKLGFDLVHVGLLKVEIPETKKAGGRP